MKKKALRKEFYMEVRKTLNRFLSILFITALGVAFFSGIRATQPDMELSADTYYDEGRLMDISVPIRPSTGPILASILERAMSFSASFSNLASRNSA